MGNLISVPTSFNEFLTPRINDETKYEHNGYTFCKRNSDCLPDRQCMYYYKQRNFFNMISPQTSLPDFQARCLCVKKKLDGKSLPWKENLRTGLFRKHEVRKNALAWKRIRRGLGLEYHEVDIEDLIQEFSKSITVKETDEDGNEIERKTTRFQEEFGMTSELFQLFRSSTILLYGRDGELIHRDSTFERDFQISYGVGIGLVVLLIMPLLIYFGYQGFNCKIDKFQSKFWSLLYFGPMVMILYFFTVFAIFNIFHIVFWLGQVAYYAGLVAFTAIFLIYLPLKFSVLRGGLPKVFAQRKRHPEAVEMSKI